QLPGGGDIGILPDDEVPDNTLDSITYVDEKGVLQRVNIEAGQTTAEFIMPVKEQGKGITLQVNAEDTWANQNTKQFVLNHDSVAPAVKETNLILNGEVYKGERTNSDITLTLAPDETKEGAHASVLKSWEYSTDGGNSWKEMTIDPTKPETLRHTFKDNDLNPKEEETTILTRMHDAAGNTSEVKEAGILYRDHINPVFETGITLTGTQREDGVYTSDVDYSIPVQDVGSGLKTVTVEVDGKAETKEYKGTTGKETISGTLSAEGTHTIKVTAVDREGNSETQQIGWSIDQHAPSLSIVSPQNKAEGVALD
ncbi:MAG: hypothetical protein RR614_15425, partial [Eubacterium sp.]